MSLLSISFLSQYSHRIVIIQTRFDVTSFQKLSHHPTTNLVFIDFFVFILKIKSYLFNKVLGILD